MTSFAVCPNQIVAVILGSDVAETTEGTKTARRDCRNPSHCWTRSKQITSGSPDGAAPSWSKRELSSGRLTWRTGDLLPVRPVRGQRALPTRSRPPADPDSPAERCSSTRRTTAFGTSRASGGLIGAQVTSGGEPSPQSGEIATVLAAAGLPRDAKPRKLIRSGRVSVDGRL